MRSANVFGTAAQHARRWIGRKIIRRCVNQQLRLHQRMLVVLAVVLERRRKSSFSTVFLRLRFPKSHSTHFFRLQGGLLFVFLSSSQWLSCICFIHLIFEPMFVANKKKKQSTERAPQRGEASQKHPSANSSGFKQIEE